MEGLVAFFSESTFLGIWIFGWNRLSRKRTPGHHLARGGRDDFLRRLHHGGRTPGCSTPSATPSTIRRTNRQLTNIWALFTNPVFLWSYVHLSCWRPWSPAASSCLPCPVWHLRRQQQVEAFKRAAAISLAVLLPAVILALFVGSELGVVEATYQPMKIAAAEAQWGTCDSHCSFSAFQIGGGNNDPHTHPDH